MSGLKPFRGRPRLVGSERRLADLSETSARRQGGPTRRRRSPERCLGNGPIPDVGIGAWPAALFCYQLWSEFAVSTPMSSLTARLSLFVFSGFAAALCAQTPSADSGAAKRTTPPPVSTSSSSAPTRRSSEVAAALAGIKFDEPQPEKKKEEPADDVDLREVDKPRNAIIRLPKYIVEGERPPVFAEKEINTKKGLAELAMKRYLSTVHQGLNRYHLPAILGGVSNEDLAMQMYHDQERLDAMRDYNEQFSLYRAAGDKDADKLQKEADKTYLRRGEFSSAADKK